MKILSLEIRNIRGIKTIKIEPEGQNVVVFGPNGTGKSALVDAVDFLLTGRISRLVGEGTKFLRLKEHGCHVDSRDDLGNTVVIAKAEVEGKTVVLERNIQRPSFLKVEPEKNRVDETSITVLQEVTLHFSFTLPFSQPAHSSFPSQRSLALRAWL